MGRFYLQVNPFSALKNIPVALSLFKHGRMPIKPTRLEPTALKQFRAILDKAETFEAHLKDRDLKLRAKHPT